MTNPQKPVNAPSTNRGLAPPSIDESIQDFAVIAAVNKASDAVGGDLNSSSAWGQLGMVMLAHGMDEKAARCLAEAAELDSTEPRWPYFRGRALRNIRPEEAAQEFRQAAEISQDAIPAPRMELAELLVEIGHLDDGERQLAKALEKYPGNQRAAALDGRIAFLRGQWESALQKLDAMTTPRKETALLQAEALRRLGRHDEAEQRIVSAETLPDPLWPDAYYQEIRALRTGLKPMLVKADLLYGSGDTLGSVKLLEEAVTSYPDSDWARILLARGLVRSNRPSEAEIHLRKAIELTPKSVEAHFRLGVALMKQKRYADAIAAYDRAVSIKPDLTMAFFNLGYCHEQLGDMPAAVEFLQRSVHTDPRFFDGWNRLGLAYQKMGDIEKARKAYERALDIEPDNRETRDQMRLLDVDLSFDPSDLDPSNPSDLEIGH